MAPVPSSVHHALRRQVASIDLGFPSKNISLRPRDKKGAHNTPRRGRTYFVHFFSVLAIVLAPAVLFMFHRSLDTAGSDLPVSYDELAVDDPDHNAGRAFVRRALQSQQEEIERARRRPPVASPPLSVLPVLGAGQSEEDVAADDVVDLQRKESSYTSTKEKEDEVPPVTCIPSPLWEKIVDTSRYEFGCKEIQEMIDGDKQLIGNGNVRNVYLLEYHGQKVVLKSLREDYGLRATKKQVDKMHRQEAAALDAVKGHPNIVGLLGLCGSSSVSEYIPLSFDRLVLGANDLLPLSKVVPMALDAARGLQALHEVPGGAIVHYDIKPHQFMVDADGRLKINDLNMCRFMGADQSGNACPFVVSHASDPGPWRAPENIAGELNLTEKVDIYSLGMVFYSMLAGMPPFQGEKNAKHSILTGVSPSIDPSWNTGFLEIVQDMWQRDASDRPSARQVVTRLEALLVEVSLQ